MDNGYKKTRLACFGGYIVQAIINNFLPILFVVFRREYGLSYESLGRIIFINFFTQIFADLLSPLIVKAIGYKGSAVVCHFLAVSGLVLLAVLPNIIGNTYLAIILSVVVYAFGSGVIEVVISPMTELLPTKNKSGNMAVLHSFYCWGQAITVILTTVLLKVFGNTYWQTVPLVLALVPALNMIFFCFVPDVKEKEEVKKSSKTNVLKEKAFYIFIIIMICSGASEIAMCQWASVFISDALGIKKVLGDILGPCAFALFMGTGRILYAFFSEKISYLKIVSVLSLVTVFCYVGVALVKIPAISLIFCAVCGFSVSMFWPGTFSYAAKTFPKGDTLMYGILALSGDLGCAMGPWLLGIVAEIKGLNLGFLATSVFPLLLFIMALLCFAKKEKNIAN